MVALPARHSATTVGGAVSEGGVVSGPESDGRSVLRRQSIPSQDVVQRRPADVGRQAVREQFDLRRQHRAGRQREERVRLFRVVRVVRRDEGVDVRERALEQLHEDRVAHLAVLPQPEALRAVLEGVAERDVGAAPRQLRLGAVPPERDRRLLPLLVAVDRPHSVEQDVRAGCRLRVELRSVDGAGDALVRHEPVELGRPHECELRQLHGIERRGEGIRVERVVVAAHLHVSLRPSRHVRNHEQVLAPGQLVLRVERSGIDSRRDQAHERLERIAGGLPGDGGGHVHQLPVDEALHPAHGHDAPREEITESAQRAVEAVQRVAGRFLLTAPSTSLTGTHAVPEKSPSPTNAGPQHVTHS